MKTILSISSALLLASASAFAMPAVGDHAEYDVSQTAAGATLTATMDYDLTAGNADGSFKMKMTVIQNNQTQTVENDVPAASFLTDASVDAVLTHCIEANGSLESITTPAGTFTACAIVQDSAEETTKTWIGKVPFGFLRQETHNKAQNSDTVLVMKAYHNG